LSRALRRAIRGTLVAGALGLAVVMAPSPSEVCAGSFTDVGPGEWFYQAVEALAAENVIGGYPDGSFRPYEPITRAEFAATTAGLLHLQPIQGGGFSDVAPGVWYAGVLAALQEAGIARGTVSGMFLPDNELTREQAAAFAVRAVAYQAGTRASDAYPAMSEAEIASWLQGFRDRTLIAPVQRGAVAQAYRLAVVSGSADGCFYPFLDLTRAQAAGILYSALLVPPPARATPAEEVPALAGYAPARQGDSGALVGWMERRLAKLSYQSGIPDGVFDARTAEAVMAFEKIEGLERTGVVSSAMWPLLAGAERPLVRRSASGARVEIDLSREVLFLIADGVVEKATPIASGREGWRTPTGTFWIQRKLPYWRESPLGLLYKPAYFYGGYAIHGSYSVPAYPASHGCVRVSVFTMDVLYPLLALETRVDVYH